MALAAHSTTLKISGTAVPVTGEATTSLGGGAYQITSSSRRIMAPSATPVVKDGGTPVSSALYAVNYQFGIITFDGYSPGGAITVDYSYLPTQAIAEVFTFNFSVKADLLDTTSYDSGGARAKKAGLVDASGSVGFRSLLTDEVDSVSHATLADVFEGGTPKLLEANFGGTILRAWVMLEGVEQTAAVAGLVEATANFQLATQTAGASYSFGT